MWFERLFLHYGLEAQDGLGRGGPRGLAGGGVKRH